MGFVTGHNILLHTLTERTQWESGAFINWFPTKNSSVLLTPISPILKLAA